MAYVVFASIDDRTLDTLGFVAGFFADHGHRVEVLTDGREVLARIWDRTPDVVVSDIMLPGRDGFDLVDAVSKREAGSRSAIVLLAVLSSEVGCWSEPLRRSWRGSMASYTSRTPPTPILGAFRRR